MKNFQSLKSLTFLAVLIASWAGFNPEFAKAQNALLDRPIAATPANAVWPWDGSDLKPEAGTTFGVLPNGMRYAIRPNKLPEKQVSLRFRIDAGSRHERDDQRGFAHFIEHMAFNGSTNIPEGELTKTMERLGASFGSHVNAHVNYSETQYKLDIPSADEGRLETALGIFRETADRLLFKEDAVKREIGVIISEMNDGEGPGRRVSRQVTEFLGPNERATLREPIGVREIVEEATSAKLREFYDTWYRPERAVLVITGDVDVAATQALISKTFSDWQAKSPVKPTDPDYGFLIKEPMRAKIIVEPEQPYVALITRLRPDPTDYGDLDTRQKRQWRGLMGLAQGVFSRRLQRLQLVDNPVTLSVGYLQQAGKTGDMVSLYVVPRDKGWAEAMKPVAIEVRQALQTGFTAEEIAEEISGGRQMWERAITEASTRRTTDLSSSLITMLGNDSVPTSALDNLAILNEVAEIATPELVSQAFARWWTQSGEAQIVLIAKEAVTGGEATVLKAWEEAMATPLPERDAVTKAVFKPLNPGPAGKVAKVQELTYPKAKIVTFDNGVRLSYMHTDYTKDRAQIRIGLNAGYLAFPPDDPHWPGFASASWSGDGIGDLTLDQTISVFANRTTGLASVRIDPDTLEMYASPASADFLEQMQVMLSQVLEPRLGPRAAAVRRDGLKQSWDSYNQTAEGVFNFYFPSLFLTGHPEYREPDLDSILKSDDAKGKQLLKRLLAEGKIHIVVVGDVGYDQVVDAVSRTFGALPARKGLPLDLTQLASIRLLPTGGPPRVLTHKGPKEQAIVYVTWTGVGDVDPFEAERKGILGDIIQLRLTDKVREAAGKSYSPSGGWSARSFANVGGFYASANVTPDQVKQIEAIMDEIAADLVRDGVTQDEINRVVEPDVKSIERSRQNNSYWSFVLSDLDTPRLPGSASGFFLDREPGREARLKAITRDELHAIAKRYLLPQNTIRVQVVPEGSAVTQTGEGSQTKPK